MHVLSLPPPPWPTCSGSNNKLNEQNNNRRNQNRLFDSQNNANAGYNVGDECDGICHPDPLTRTYDSTIPGGAPQC